MTATTRSSSSAPERRPPRPPVPPGVQRIVVVVGIALAVGAIVLAARYQADTNPSQAVQTGSPADGGGVRPDDPNAPRPELVISPVEGWFPRSGTGSTCSEPVGVDLVPGYGATLVINGHTLTPDQLNAPSSAGRSLGHFTYGPEEDCPNGALLRPVDNVVQACVYRVEEGPDGCQLTERFTFNAL